MAVQPLEEICQAGRESAYRCTGCSFRALTLSSIVKPTIGCVGCFETARNTETAGTPMQYFFSPPFPAGN
jgi:hypothetical protein